MRTPKTPDFNRLDGFPEKRNSDSRKLSMADLISIDELQEMQDSFSEIAKVSVRTVDACGNLMTNVSRLYLLCSKVFQSTALIEKYCNYSKPAFLGGSSMVDEDLSYECLSGLKSYIIPLKVSISRTDSLIVGYMIIGPVFFMKREEKENYREIASELNVGLDEIWSYTLELRVFSHKGIHSLLEMIENLTSRILTLAYNRFLSQGGISDKQPDKDAEQVGHLPERTEEFLETFLDFIVAVTAGDIVSVMLFDKTKGTLAIRACRGLSEEIVNKTSIKLGEGLSGLAVAGKRSFLINEDVVNTDLDGRLKRDEIFSSMIVPIKYRDKVLGVVNVSSSKNSLIKFDKAALSLLTKASSLAGITLDQLIS